MAENVPFVVRRYAVEWCLQGMPNSHEGRIYAGGSEIQI